MIIKSAIHYAVRSDEEILISRISIVILEDIMKVFLLLLLDGETYGYIGIIEKIIIPFQYQNRTLSKFFWWQRIYFGLTCAKLNNKKYSRECVLINHHNEQVFPYILNCDILSYRNGRFENTGWSKIGDRFKHGQISLYDLICNEKGKDMSYLIRTDEEIEIEQRKRKRQRERRDRTNG